MTNRSATSDAHTRVNRDVRSDIYLLLNLHRLRDPMPGHALAVLHLTLHIRRENGAILANPSSGSNLDERRIVDGAIFMDADFVVDTKVISVCRREGRFDFHTRAKEASLRAWDDEVVRGVLARVDDLF